MCFRSPRSLLNIPAGRGGFFHSPPWRPFGAYASFVRHSLLILVIAFLPLSQLYLRYNQERRRRQMAETKNLCAQIPLDLHAKVCEAKERLGITTSQYMTGLLRTYFTIFCTQ